MMRMIQRSGRACLIAALMAGAACSGTGQAATRSWPVGDVSQIRVEGPFDVRVHIGGTPSAYATGPQAQIEQIAVEQRDGLLVIRPTGVWRGWNQREPLIDVTMRALGAATLAGSGDMTLDRVRGDVLALTVAGSGDLTASDVAVSRATLTLNGSGDLTVSGTAGQAKASLNGSGDVNGKDLRIGDLDAMLVGSGDMALHADRTAAVRLVGSGDVTIEGDARCTTHVSGSGEAHCTRAAP